MYIFKKLLQTLGMIFLLFTMKVIEYAQSWQIYSWLDQELTF